jgi:SAM-dependent methyltransferase
MEFWDELCGSALAKHLGISDNSPESLRKFDDWYLNFYPFLREHIPFATIAGLKVLEIGLGYGTVAQKLMEADAKYHGLDIAEGPVAMARHRAVLLGKAAEIAQGSALSIPYPESTFDQVVTIGCLHHTGNLAKAFQEVHRVTKKDGRATIMVYSALSYRQWMREPLATFRRARKPEFEWSNADSDLRGAYDANQEGGSAPSTTFVSPKEAKIFLQQHFRVVEIFPRNIGQDFTPARFLPRSLARALFERALGLDLYIECVK